MAAPKQHTKIHFTHVLKWNTKTPRDMIKIRSTGIMYSTVTILPKTKLTTKWFKKKKVDFFGRQKKRKIQMSGYKLSLNLSFKL